MITITTPHELNRYLNDSTVPTVVCYNDGGRKGEQLVRELQCLDRGTLISPDRILVVEDGVLPVSHYHRRALNRLPALAFHTGWLEVERLTGFTPRDRIEAAIQRLKDVYAVN